MVATLSSGRTITLGPSPAGKALSLLEAIKVHEQPVLETPLRFSADGVQWAVPAYDLLHYPPVTAHLPTDLPTTLPIYYSRQRVRVRVRGHVCAHSLTG